MHSALIVILFKYYIIANPTQKGLDKMISIIQDKNHIESDEEFHERVSNYGSFRKIVQAVQERTERNTQNAVARHYNAIVTEISRLSSSKSDHDRLRFLEKARDSFGLCLSSEEDVSETNQIDCPAYYILLHFLEDGEKITYIGIDEKGKVTFKIDGSDLARAAVFLVDKFQPLLQIKHSRKDIEVMLGSLLN